MSGIARQDDPPELELDIGIVCRVIEFARSVLAREETDEADPGDDDNDPAQASVREPDTEGDAEIDGFRIQLESALQSLDDEQQERILALFLIGRGDFDASELDEALTAAADRRLSLGGVASTLLGAPLLAEHLEAGLEAFGRDCAGEGTPSEDSAEGATASSVTSDVAGERVGPVD